MMEENPYLSQIEDTLPRLLALFDTDKTSKSYGLGDRYYWAWGLIDFGNATFQSAAHGMARLWVSGLWPYNTKREDFIERIDAIFQGANFLMRKDGSLEEAFPNEGSFCVTSLVAFDLLVTVDLLRDEVTNDMLYAWRKIIEPMIKFVIKSDETHAFISNHLATAAAALIRWSDLSGDNEAEKKAKTIINDILNNQSSEGWFKEYEGADPGYQSLCTYYLADVHKNRPTWNLVKPLERSIKFLYHFAHPDGSFGGLYGSRSTRFYYPAGVEYLANEIKESALLANFMSEGIASSCVVTLKSMDESNLVPMFNAYCWAASMRNEKGIEHQYGELPAFQNIDITLHFPEAGIIINRGNNYSTIISTHKGGVVTHFVGDKQELLDPGVVVKNSSGLLGSSQSYSPSNKIKIENNIVEIHSNISPMPKQLPTPLKFIVLRILSQSIFRVSKIREWVKKLLVKMLITNQKKWPVKNIRKIHLGSNIKIDDNIQLPLGYTHIQEVKSFVPIHMASKGYWQLQDEETNR